MMATGKWLWTRRQGHDNRMDKSKPMLKCARQGHKEGEIEIVLLVVVVEIGVVEKVQRHVIQKSIWRMEAITTLSGWPFSVFSFS